MLDEEEGDEAGAELRHIDYGELSLASGFLKGRIRRRRRGERRSGRDRRRAPPAADAEAPGGGAAGTVEPLERARRAEGGT
jgi:hypothetical protein